MKYWDARRTGRRTEWTLARSTRDGLLLRRGMTWEAMTSYLDGPPPWPDSGAELGVSNDRCTYYYAEEPLRFKIDEVTPEEMRLTLAAPQLKRALEVALSAIDKAMQDGNAPAEVDRALLSLRELIGEELEGCYEQLSVDINSVPLLELG